MINLFKEWPAKNIGVITDRIFETDPDSPYLYYQLGDKEIGFPFPFGFVQKKVCSGPYYFQEHHVEGKVQNEPRAGFGKIKSVFRKTFDLILKRSGLNIYFYKIRLSNELKDWITEFNPDIIYVQPFLFRIMKFGNNLFKELKIPYAVHIMDDSISFINRVLICKNMRQRILEAEFRNLINNATVCLSITDDMSNEYQKRYGRRFQAFRNPIEIESWMPFRKSDLKVKDHSLKIIYTGRLQPPTFYSLLDMCYVVNDLNKRDMSVTFDIFSHDFNASFSRMTEKYEGVNFKPPVSVTAIPEMVQHYDIFFLCLDFDDHARRYSQFSISTRTSEGMVSSLPILFYGPEDTAQFKYLKNSQAALLVGDRRPDLLKKGIIDLWHDLGLRERLSKRALDQVIIDSDADIVRKSFKRALNIETSDSQ